MMPRRPNAPVYARYDGCACVRAPELRLLDRRRRRTGRQPRRVLLQLHRDPARQGHDAGRIRKGPDGPDNWAVAGRTSDFADEQMQQWERHTPADRGGEAAPGEVAGRVSHSDRPSCSTPRFRIDSAFERGRPAGGDRAIRTAIGPDADYSGTGAAVTSPLAWSTRLRSSVDEKGAEAAAVAAGKTVRRRGASAHRLPCGPAVPVPDLGADGRHDPVPHRPGHQSEGLKGRRAHDERNGLFIRSVQPSRPCPRA